MEPCVRDALLTSPVFENSRNQFDILHASIATAHLPRGVGLSLPLSPSPPLLALSSALERTLAIER